MRALTKDQLCRVLHLTKRFLGSHQGISPDLTKRTTRSKSGIGYYTETSINAFLASADHNFPIDPTIGLIIDEGIEFVSFSEAKKLLGISSDSARRALSRGDIEYIRYGRNAICITQKSLEAYMVILKKQAIDPLSRKQVLAILGTNNWKKYANLRRRAALAGLQLSNWPRLDKHDPTEMIKLLDWLIVSDLSASEWLEKKLNGTLDTVEFRVARTQLRLTRMQVMMLLRTRKLEGLMIPRASNVREILCITEKSIVTYLASRS